MNVAHRGSSKVGLTDSIAPLQAGGSVVGFSAHWRPFADMSSAEPPLAISSGIGARIRTADGSDYLDATAGLWFCQAGFGRAEIADVARDQLISMHAYHCFGDYTNIPAMRLAEVLSTLAPGGPWKVFFTSGGSDSVETAVKFARRYWGELGEPGRTVFLSRSNSYHGMHAAGTQIGGIDSMRAGYGELLANAERVPFDDADALEAHIQRIGPEKVAAFFCEPIIGAGGVHFPPDGYLHAVEEICRRHRVLFVLDEVVSGFGRCGTWFAAERFDIEPDLILCAKGINSGYLPLGAVLVHCRAAEPFWTGQAEAIFRHGYTYSGHAAATATALANIDYLDQHGLLAASRRIEEQLPDLLAGLIDIDLVSEIRTGPAALAAIQLDPQLVSVDPGLPQRAVRALRSQGILTRAMSCGALQISPTLAIAEHEMTALGVQMRIGLTALASE